MLIVLCGVAVAGFGLTRAAARAAERQRLHDAEVWYGRGTDWLRAGQLSDAVAALRRAVNLDRDRQDYSLSLARALAADAQDDAARQTLLALRATAPEDPDVNLTLARLEAARQDVASAVVHYQSALYGEWDPARLDDRQQIRLEFIRYLLERGMRDRALSELLVLAADLPESAGEQTAVAALFLEAGEAGRAITLYSRALRLEPANPAALSGAARAALALDDFARAREFLRGVKADESSDLGRLRRTVDLALANDPLQAGLSIAERRHRTRRGLEWAAAFASSCRGRGSGDALEALLADAAALRKSMPGTAARDVRAAGESAVRLIGRITEELKAACAPDQPADRAWWLIAERHASPAV